MGDLRHDPQIVLTRDTLTKVCSNFTVFPGDVVFPAYQRPRVYPLCCAAPQARSSQQGNKSLMKLSISQL
jgi:hypothetical protein